MDADKLCGKFPSRNCNIYSPIAGHGTEWCTVLLETIHQRCFDMIKRICYKTPILRLIDYQSDEPVWLICDASKTGVGVIYGQGPMWNVCRPAGFMSKKFTHTTTLCSARTGDTSRPRGPPEMGRQTHRTKITCHN